MTIDKPIYDKRKLERLNGNVIKLPISDEWWLIKEKEKDDDGDSESKKKKIIKRHASYDALIDNPMLAAEYWEQRWQDANNKNDFKNAYDYMKWSLAFEDQPFNKGGLVNSKKSGLASLAENAVASDLLKAVRSGIVALQFSPPSVQRKLKQR